ncbi:MAG: hypothetical protein JRJ69_10425 [Deltaproteobacteria bacterium]|nr:hypothetical protein [Deltaproteobacteria bacterium]
MNAVIQRMHTLFETGVVVSMPGSTPAARLIMAAAISFIDPSFPGLNKVWKPRLLNLHEIMLLFSQLKRDGLSLAREDLKKASKPMTKTTKTLKDTLEKILDLTDGFKQAQLHDEVFDKITKEVHRIGEKMIEAEAEIEEALSRLDTIVLDELDKLEEV